MARVEAFGSQETNIHEVLVETDRMRKVMVFALEEMQRSFCIRFQCW